MPVSEACSNNSFFIFIVGVFECYTHAPTRVHVHLHVHVRVLKIFNKSLACTCNRLVGSTRSSLLQLYSRSTFTRDITVYIIMTIQLVTISNSRQVQATLHYQSHLCYSSLIFSFHCLLKPSTAKQLQRSQMHPVIALATQARFTI